MFGACFSHDWAMFGTCSVYVLGMFGKTCYYTNRKGHIASASCAPKALKQKNETGNITPEHIGALSSPQLDYTTKSLKQNNNMCEVTLGASNMQCVAVVPTCVQTDQSAISLIHVPVRILRD